MQLVHAPFTEIFTGIAGHAQKGVVRVHNLLPFDDIDPDYAGTPPALQRVEAADGNSRASVDSCMR